MVKNRRFLAALLVMLALTLVPTQALADSRPRASEVCVNGVSLSSQSVAGASYNPNAGILTLNNYNGGPIQVSADASRPANDRELDLTVILVGDNIITSTGGYGSSGISIPGASNDPAWTNDLEIVSYTNGSLTINRMFEQGHSQDISFYGIVAGGLVEIGGSARVTINMSAGNVSSVKNSYGIGVVAAGIECGNLGVVVSDPAQLNITVSGDGLQHACGMLLGGYGMLNISTYHPVTIDLTHAYLKDPGSGSNNYPGDTAGIDSSKNANPLSLVNCARLTVKAGYVCHTVTGNMLNNFHDIGGYIYEGWMGQYTNTHTHTCVMPFRDVTGDTAHVGDILWLYDIAITQGYPDGTFKPMYNVKRCDMAAFLYRQAGSPDFTPSAADRAFFKDVTASTPHAKEIWWMAHEGISQGWVVGGKRYFRPMNDIARADMAAFLMRLSWGADAENHYSPSIRAVNAFKDVTFSTSHSVAIWWLYDNGITTGFPDGTFRPYDNIKRCDMAAFLHRLYYMPLG